MTAAGMKPLVGAPEGSFVRSNRPIDPNPACEMTRVIGSESRESKLAGLNGRRCRKRYFPPASSIQLSTSRQSVMRIGVPWTPVSNSAILMG